MLSSILIIHFIAGAIALLSGYAAIFYKKGDSGHKRIGQVYVIAMLALGISGSFVAVFRDVPLSLMNGLVLCYFVLSSSNCIRQGANQTNWQDKLLLLASWLLSAGFAWFAWQASISPGGQLGGFGAVAYLAFGSVLLFSAIADTRYVLTGGLAGKYRLVRHLWRMFFPLFMSTAAFFLGQAKLLPKSLQTIEILLAPVVLVIITMLYWTIKIRFTKLAV